MTTPYRSNEHKPVKVTFRQRWHSTEGKHYLHESCTFNTAEEAAAFVLGLRHGPPRKSGRRKRNVKKIKK